MSDKIYLTDDQIEAILGRIESLDAKERRVVESMLDRIRRDGIYKSELERELGALRAKYEISEIDYRNIKEAIFKA